MHPWPAARSSNRPKSTCRLARTAAARRGASGLAGGVAVAAILLGLVLPGTAFAEVPQPGTDVMRAAGSVEITVDGIGTDYVRLLGDISIVRHPPDPITPDEIPIEIVSMNLAGLSPVFGRVGITPCVGMPSTGLTRRALPVESPSDSFFDVWFDIALPDRGLELTQAAYFRIEARTTAVPFFDVFTGRYSQMVPLVDDLSGMPMGSLTHVALDPNPRIDRLATQAELDWTLGTVREVVMLNGESMVVASDSWINPGPIGAPEFNTELVAMDLTGATPIHGPMEFHEQMQIHSPGRSVAKNPGPGQFPADSFFDVFFEISGFFSPGSPGGASAFSPAEAGADPTFYNDSGVLVIGSISSWPAFNTPYKNPGPVNLPLFDRSTGQMVGTANGLQWVWTQPAGDCVDADGDGVFAPPCGTDCDDRDPNNYPGNLESCADGRDNNCNQAIDCQDPLCVGRPCDDGNLCTQDDRCIQAPIGNICRGTPVSCDDSNPCTQDFCETATGLCRHIPQFDVPCDDGDACTQGDRCLQGPGGGAICQGAPLNCDDGNLCTTDSCDPLTGLCVHEAVSCDDDDPCTSDRCLPTTGECSHEPKSCNDFDPCTSDSCQPQACMAPDNGGGTADLPTQCPYNADGRLGFPQPDGTILFIETLVHRAFTCPPATPAVCSFPSPVPGVDCSQAGGTLGGEQACADSFMRLRFTHFNPFTNVSKSRTADVPVSFEMHAAPRVPGAPVQSFATDMYRMFGQLPPGDPDFGLLRFTAGTDFGLPSPGHTTLTQAGGNWGVDSFFDITYRIDFVGAPSSFLAGFSSSVSNTARFETGGGCVNVPVNCDDNDPCTTDRCDPETGACLHAPLSCDDGDACTTDSCDPQTGACVHTPLTCDDGNACTVNDHCVSNPFGGTACVGDPKDCQDGDPCTDDTCMPPNGQCVHTPVPCDDQDACTSDTCVPVGCVVPDNGSGTADLPPSACPYIGEQKLMILDGIQPAATIEIDAVQGGFSCPAVLPSSWVCAFPSPIPGVDCSQGSPAAGEQACASSVMGMHMVGTGTLAGFVRDISMSVNLEEHLKPRVPGAPLQSFDTDMYRMFGQLPPGDPDFDLLRLACGTDFGLPSPGHTVLTQMGGSWGVDSFFDITCRIDFVGAAGSPLMGRSGSTTGTYRFRTRGGQCVHTPVNCDDNDPCTTDRCDPETGACLHAPLSCDDGDACTTDSCDPQTGACVHTPLTCDDQNPCTFDRCDPADGSCVHVLNTCDDGDACTQDACNPATGACDHRPVTVMEPDPILFRDQVTISWSATPDASHWNTYRGSIPKGLLGSRLPAPVYDQACYESDDAGGNGPTTAIDAANPPLGTAFYYLTSGENTCGESAIGHPSSPPGAVIPNTMPCPTPP